jgi:hypothetical protein
MRIAYLGLDEVNRYVVRKWARQEGAGLRLLNVRCETLPTGIPALVVDVDSLPEPHRRRWLERIVSSAAAPVLVFGHMLSDREAAELIGNGVHVVRRVLRRGRFRRWFENEVLCSA